MKRVALSRFSLTTVCCILSLLSNTILYAETGSYELKNPIESKPATELLPVTPERTFRFAPDLRRIQKLLNDLKASKSKAATPASHADTAAKAALEPPPVVSTKEALAPTESLPTSKPVASPLYSINAAPDTIKPPAPKPALYSINADASKLVPEPEILLPPVIVPKKQLSSTLYSLNEGPPPAPVKVTTTAGPSVEVTPYHQKQTFTPGFTKQQSLYSLNAQPKAVAAPKVSPTAASISAPATTPAASEPQSILGSINDITEPLPDLAEEVIEKILDQPEPSPNAAEAAKIVTLASVATAALSDSEEEKPAKEKKEAIEAETEKPTPQPVTEVPTKSAEETVKAEPPAEPVIESSEPVKEIAEKEEKHPPQVVAKEAVQEKPKKKKIRRRKKIIKKRKKPSKLKAVITAEQKKGDASQNDAPKHAEPVKQAEKTTSAPEQISEPVDASTEAPKSVSSLDSKKHSSLGVLRLSWPIHTSLDLPDNEGKGSSVSTTLQFVIPLSHRLFGQPTGLGLGVYKVFGVANNKSLDTLRAASISLKQNLKFEDLFFELAYVVGHPWSLTLGGGVGWLGRADLHTKPRLSIDDVEASSEVELESSEAFGRSWFVSFGYYVTSRIEVFLSYRSSSMSYVFDAFNYEVEFDDNTIPVEVSEKTQLDVTLSQLDLGLGWKF